MAEIIKLPNQKDVYGGYATYKNEAGFVSPDRISDESAEKIEQFNKKVNIYGTNGLRRFISEKKLAA